MIKRMLLSLTCLVMVSCSTSGTPNSENSTEAPTLETIMARPLYRGSRWGLRVVDADTGQVLLEKSPDQKFFIGSVRKLFSVGLLLNEVGPERTFDTPVFRTGPLDGSGTLRGNLVVVASGDLAMGGHRNPDGSLAIPDFDHNEANSLGNAQLTPANPLAGFESLADQIVASGVRKVEGDVVVDARLFQPFPFRGEFEATAMFVNDDVVDLTLTPATPGALANLTHRPRSAALQVVNQLRTGPRGSALNLTLTPEEPPLGGTGVVGGNLPVDVAYPFTGQPPLVRNFRISDPNSYARTVLIEALQARGVAVQAAPVQPNNEALLPAPNSYLPANQVALLRGTPYRELARWILKVSYNLGADNSLMLLGVERGVNTMAAALVAERALLVGKLGLDGASFDFVDGSGGGETRASNAAVTGVLLQMLRSPAAVPFAEGLPRLGVDGSLATVQDFASDATLAGARGQVHAKTGTFVTAGPNQTLLLRGQALGGFIDTRSGRRVIYHLVVNEVPLGSFEDLIQVFQDEGRISALLWRDL